ncbi:bifunctional riboflavin kinase/FAD synthetase [Pseudochrobactrum sp. MP213Fo]|uniref:bifunctional riboflavin kinase/FAD synthetase n=1 Tax=Pseudochrobactrum sp. MP213Fo TaxID=3022250 RepID=UPI003BA3B3CB
MTKMPSDFAAQSAILRLTSDLSGAEPLPAHLRGSVVAIGNFDGVHRGHQAVLKKTLELAKMRQCPAVVLTFEPHPRSFFNPEQPVDRLTDAQEKAAILGLLGFDVVVEQAFDASFSGLSAQEFIDQILIERLGASEVITGVDFHFGTKRQGNPAFLQQAGERHGFGVTLIEPFTDEGGAIVSSSRIREDLAEGDVVAAAALLGYHYTLASVVIKGRQLGRTLGFPTANMALPLQTGLKHGIYAVRFRRADGTLYDGVASFGRRPTVDSDGSALLETFVFDFSGDLYGEFCSVSFFAYLRGEEKFDSLDALMVQMHRDEAEARAILSGVQSLSQLDSYLTFPDVAADAD